MTFLNKGRGIHQCTAVGRENEKICRSPELYVLCFATPVFLLGVFKFNLLGESVTNRSKKVAQNNKKDVVNGSCSMN